MVRLDTLGAQKSRGNRRKVAAAVVRLVGDMVAMRQAHHDFCQCKTQMHTSVLTGEAWIQELLAGHPVRFQRSMGMAKHVFSALSAVSHTAFFGDGVSSLVVRGTLSGGTFS